MDGKMVILEDGTRVLPSDVCKYPAPAKCFAFTFLPDESYVDHFIKEFENSMFENFNDDSID